MLTEKYKKISKIMVILSLIMAVLFIGSFTHEALGAERSIQMEWSQEEDSRITGWNVYHSTNREASHEDYELFTSIDKEGSSDTYSSEQALPTPDGEETTHFFYMTSTDDYGNESEPSEVASITLDLTPLVSPTNLIIINVVPEPATGE